MGRSSSPANRYTSACQLFESKQKLTAVCEPTQTDDMFFYFYPDADGNMQAAFSKTYEEHQQAIADNSNAGGADGSGDAAAGEGAAA